MIRLSKLLSRLKVCGSRARQQNHNVAMTAIMVICPGATRLESFSHLLGFIHALMLRCPSLPLCSFQNETFPFILHSLGFFRLVLTPNILFFFLWLKQNLNVPKSKPPPSQHHLPPPRTHCQPTSSLQDLAPPPIPMSPPRSLLLQC